MENAHIWEAHNETAEDNFCGQCGTSHDWRAGCADDIEDDDDQDESSSLIRPVINLNGTSADELIAARITACEAITDALEALKLVTPNGRDYPGDNDRCRADREKHYARLAQLTSIKASIYAEAIAINQQKEGK